MAIKKTPDGSRRRSYGPKGDTASGIESTFRQDDSVPANRSRERQPTTKTTFDLETKLFTELKLHAVQERVPMRDLVDRYIREGLAADRQNINP